MTRQATGGLRHRAWIVRRALTGRTTRRALMDYLKMVALIMVVLLMIAWAIDLADNLNAIRRDARARDVPVLSLLAPYLTYRTADMVTRMLPMACFFGVYLAEIGRRLRLETVILKAAGASPLRLLAGVLLFAVLTGVLQHKLENTWRPAAVVAQVELGHGAYARRFSLDWTTEHRWVVTGDVAIRGQVRRAPPGTMRDVLIFVGIRSHRLETIYAADRLVPGAEPGEWIAKQGTRWQATADGERVEPFESRSLTLDLIPEQIAHIGVPAFYLPAPALHAIATMRDAPTAPGADLAIWQRLSAWTLPGTFALLAFCLANAGFSGRRPDIPRLVALACLGYVSVVSVKVFWALGELAVISAPVAVFASVGLVWALSLWLLRRQS